MSSPPSVWENHYGSSNVDFSPDTVPPIEPGRFLGPGVNGGVYETSFNGATLAWKIYCRHAIRLNDCREIESVERLRHKHIISIILLFWPVAVCDLWAFLEDLEEFRNFLADDKEPNETWMDTKGRGTSLNSKTTRTSFTRYISAGSIVATVALQMLFLMSTNNISSTKISNHERPAHSQWPLDHGFRSIDGLLRYRRQ